MGKRSSVKDWCSEGITACACDEIPVEHELYLCSASENC